MLYILVSSLELSLISSGLSDDITVSQSRTGSVSVSAVVLGSSPRSRGQEAAAAGGGYNELN